MNQLSILAASAYLAAGLTAAREMQFCDDEMAGRLPAAAQTALIIFVWPYCLYRVCRYGWLP